MKRYTFLTVSFFLLLMFQIISAQETPNPDTTAESTPESTIEAAFGDVLSIVNIELVFDASGSMAAALSNGELRIDAAQRAVGYLIETLPVDDPNIQIGFRVFGHEGDNTEANRVLSCQSTELIVPIGTVDKTALSGAVASYTPTGWTPITLALTEAARDFQPISTVENAVPIRNVIIIVTDGEETCDADPCAAALALAESDAEIVAHVIGFGLEPGVADTLRCIADNSGGLYFDAAEGDALAGILLSLVGAETARAGFDFFSAMPTMQFPEIQFFPFQPIPFPDFPGFTFQFPEFPPSKAAFPPRHLSLFQRWAVAFPPRHR